LKVVMFLDVVIVMFYLAIICQLLIWLSINVFVRLCLYCSLSNLSCHEYYASVSYLQFAHAQRFKQEAQLSLG